MSSVETPNAKLPGLRKLSPKEQSQRAAAFACLSNDGKITCERVVSIGIFFDGTNNNKYRDKNDGSYSNVAVLFDAHRDSSKTGYFRYYIPGLGTPFPEIGEMRESDDGKATGAGGDSRIHYAMIQVYNSIFRAVHGDRDLVPAAEARRVVTSQANGLKTAWLLGKGKRAGYFGELEKQLVASIFGKRPIVKLINLSVFGFSRGAAEARAFCNWLSECCAEGTRGGYRFCGIPIRFQFVGIFDTVASVGIADSSPVGSGFLDWADGTMRIPEIVERCVHFVAAHEIRKSFPLSSSRDKSIYPSNCVEVVYPGAHCDVGGGYSPADQGKAIGDRSNLVSQIPLVHMYLEAQKTGVPLLSMRELDAEKAIAADFQISKQLAIGFRDYAEWSRSQSVTVEKVLFDHMRLYWRWRIQAGPNFKELSSYKAANAQDREDMLASEKDFLQDMWHVERIKKHHGPMSLVRRAAADEKRSKLTVPVTVWRFFDEHIHDSHASFRLLGPMTADDRSVAIARIKERRTAGKVLNRLERRVLAADAISPGSFPVMSDADTADLHEITDLVASRAVKTITDTRREADGHIRNRRVFDES
jgi:hypothetical protein